MPPGGASLLALVVVVLGGIVATSFAGPNLGAVGIARRAAARPAGRLVRLWALSRGVDVPRHVDRRRRRVEAQGPGAALAGPGHPPPGVLTAGTFRSHGEKDLWMVGRGKEVLVIELHDERYRHLILEVEDPHWPPPPSRPRSPATHIYVGLVHRRDRRDQAGVAMR